jgi:hypothetical protein
MEAEQECILRQYGLQNIMEGLLNVSVVIMFGEFARVG